MLNLINKLMKKIVALLIFSSISLSYSQGCSDAGICSFSNATSQKNDSISFKNNFDLGITYGQGLEGVTYYSTTITYSRILNSKLNVASKLNYNQAQGDFGTRGQFGDLFLLGSYTVSNKKNKLNTNFGAKIPLSNANLKINNTPLPMDYQASLGTIDLLIGMDYYVNKWKFDTALQLPIVNFNKNSYFDEYSLSNDFPTTNLFKRKPDVLVRTTYLWDLAPKKWIFKPNLLFIYHLGKDSFEDIFGKRNTIQNSDGLTINANLISTYKITSNQQIETSIAAPLLVREIRPDGLTRSFTFSLNYKLFF